MHATLRFFLIVALSAGSGLGAPPKGDAALKSLPPLAPYWRCDKEMADISLVVESKIESALTKKKEVIYLQRATEGSRIPAPYHMSSNADGVSQNGKGIGYGYSILVIPIEDGAKIAISTTWTLGEGRGTSDLDIVVPYLSDRKGKIPGLTYSCVWKKLK